MTLQRRVIGSALQGAGVALFVTVGIAGAGLLLNWAFLLVGIGPVAGVLRGTGGGGGVGPFSYGFLVLLLGIAFPLGWLLAAQSHATRLGMRRLYRGHKSEVLSILTRFLEREMGERTLTVEGWTHALQKLRASLEQYPPVIQPVLRLALRQAKIEQLEAALQGGSGPISTRLTGALDSYIEEDLIGSGARWLWVAFALNAAAILGILLAVRGAA